MIHKYKTDPEAGNQFQLGAGSAGVMKHSSCNTFVKGVPHLSTFQTTQSLHETGVRPDSEVSSAFNTLNDNCEQIKL